MTEAGSATGSLVLAFDDVLRLLREREPFALSRFGDGEWAAILGEKGANCDGSPYTDDLGDALRRVLCKSQRYSLGWHGVSHPNHYQIAPARQWMAENRKGLPPIEWGKSDVFHLAFKEGRILELVRALRRDSSSGFDAFLVGFEAPKAIPLFVRHDVRVGLWSTDPVHAFEETGRVVESLAHALKSETQAVVLFACGMGACVMIDRLYEEFPDATLIDLGSVLDPWMGRSNRSFLRKYGAQYGF